MSISKLKTLYTFEIPIIKEVEETSIRKNEKDEEVKEIKKVQKSVPRKIALRKPTRDLIDAAELYFNVTVSEGIAAGLMSRALLAKRFNNDGGVFSEPQKQAYQKGYYELDKRHTEKTRLLMKSESALTEEDKAQLEILTKEIGALQRELQSMELSEISLYDITAEARARTKTVLWWVLFLTYFEREDVRDVWEPLFIGDTIKQKLDSYDAIEEGDNMPPADREFFLSATRRAAAATAFWFYGKAKKQEDFLELEKDLDAPSKKEEEKKEKTAKTDESVPETVTPPV